MVFNNSSTKNKLSSASPPKHLTASCGQDGRFGWCSVPISGEAFSSSDRKTIECANFKDP